MRRALLLPCVLLSTTASAQIRRPDLGSRAELDTRDPQDGTRSEGGASATQAAPLSDLTYRAGSLTLEPQLVVLETAATVPQTDTKLRLRLPGLGLRSQYGLTDAVGVFAALYGTRQSGTFDTPVLSGDATLSLGVAAIGAAYRAFGEQPEARVRLVLAGALMGLTMTLHLDDGEARGVPVSDRQLFQLNAMAALLAAQLEWRIADHVALVPFVTAWRIVARRLEVGADRTRAEHLRPWHLSPGADVWLYLSPVGSSHIGLSALVNLTSDAPTTTFTLGYAFTF